MLYILIIPVLLVFVLLFIVYNRVRLPVNVNSLINEIKKEELPEFVTGKTGFANNNDIKIAYEILDSKKPNGETIVLISGLGQSRLVWPTYFYQPFLDQGYNIIIFDNRGLGESDWIMDWTKENSYSLEDMATDAIAVLDALNITQAHFVGMSMGGMISQRIAISHPTRILTLTSVMSTGFYGDPDLVSVSKTFYANIIGVTLLYARKLKTDAQKMKFVLSNQRLLKGKGDYKIDNKKILQKAYYEIIKRKGFNWKVSDQHSMAIKISGSRYEELKNIKTPSLVIHGINDPLIKIEHAKKYATLIPNAKTLFIKGMGHDLPEKYIPDIHKSIFKNFINKIKLTKTKIMKVKQYQKASFLLVLMLFCISLVSAQTTITGTISNQDNEPIIGANIIIKGTAAGTASDLDGKFSLTSEQALPWDLVFSYAGYNSKTVSVTKANQFISVVLEQGISLDEIIISASRKAEKIQDAPASVSVVTAKEIKNQTVANPISLLENTVGVSIDKQGAGRTNITMRGGTDLLATSVFVMMDYRSLIGSGLNTFDANATTLLPIDIDRVEVIRGPGSALYGPGVTSGVVHFLTKDPFKYPGGTIELSAGNLNTLKTNFRYADHNENKTFGYKLTAFTSKSDEWGLDPNNATDAATLATFQNDIIDPIDGRLVGQTGGNLNEKGKSYGGTGSLYFRPGNSGLNIVTTTGFNYTEGLYWSSQGEGYQAATDFYAQGRVSYKGLFAQAYYNSNKGSDEDAKKGFLYRTGNLSIVDREQFEGQLQYNFDIESIKTNITVGGDYRAARFDTSGRTFGRFEDTDNYDLYGTYIQSKTNLSDKLDLVLAARYDAFSAIDENSFAPRLALVYKANDDHTFRVSYNTAFAPNSALDLFIDQPIGDAGAFDLWLHGNSTEQTFNNIQTTFLNGLPTTAGIGIGVGDAYNAFTPAVIQSISAIPAFQPVLPFLLPILQSAGFANAIATNGGFSNGIPIDINGNILAPNGTPKSTLREENTFEIGYTGKITNKLKASLDLYRVNKKNFTGIRQISPLVVFPTVSSDVNAVLAPTLTAAFTAAYSGYLQSVGYNAVTADAIASQTAASVVPGVAAVYDGVASAFFNNADGTPGVRGLVQSDQAPTTGSPHLMYGYRNFGEVTYDGADLGLNYDLNENVKLFGNYSWVSQNSFIGEDFGEPGSTDRFDLNFSQHRVRLGASYEPLTGLQAGLSLKYNNEFESTLGVYNGTVAARTLLDMNLGYQLDNGLFFNLSIDNLLGEKYRTFPAMPEIGTQFLATARYTFGGKK